MSGFTFPGMDARTKEIAMADELRAEVMRLLHEERDQDRALLEKLVTHLTLPPRSTWRVVNLGGDDTPRDVGIEFPAQVIYIQNGTTEAVTVQAPGDIAPSPAIAAGLSGSWLIPGATQVTIKGSGTGQVRCRFLNEAAARLVYATTPLGGSSGSPLYTEATGNLAPLTAGAPVLLATYPYTDFAASTSLRGIFTGVLHRNARARVFSFDNALNEAIASASIFLFDSVVNGGAYGIGGSANITLSAGFPANFPMFYNSQAEPGLAANLDSAQINLSMGTTAPTSGDVTFWVTEAF